MVCCSDESFEVCKSLGFSLQASLDFGEICQLWGNLDSDRDLGHRFSVLGDVESGRMGKVGNISLEDRSQILKETVRTENLVRTNNLSKRGVCSSIAGWFQQRQLFFISQLSVYRNHQMIRPWIQKSAPEIKWVLRKEKSHILTLLPRDKNPKHKSRSWTHCLVPGLPTRNRAGGAPWDLVTQVE